MHYSGRSALLVGSVALIIFSSPLVNLRLISRRLSAARLWWDDAFIAISLLVSYSYYAGVMLSSPLRLSPTFSGILANLSQWYTMEWEDIPILSH